MQDNQNLDSEKKNRWPNLIAALFVLTSVGIAAFMGWQNYSLDLKEEGLKAAIENQKESLVTLEKREQIGEQMRAVSILRRAQTYRKNWSVVLSDLNTAFTNDGLVKFNSVSVDNDNTVTIRGEAQDFLAAAGFLILVKRSENFDNAFISTINPSGGTQEEDQFYQFSATFDYVKDIQKPASN